MFRSRTGVSTPATNQCVYSFKWFLSVEVKIRKDHTIVTRATRRNYELTFIVAEDKSLFFKMLQ